MALLSHVFEHKISAKNEIAKHCIAIVQVKFANQKRLDFGKIDFNYRSPIIRLV